MCPTTPAVRSFVLLALLLLGTSSSALEAPNTILAVANGAGLKQLVAAIGAVGGPLLAAVSNSSTAVTVFAPTDEVGDILRYDRGNCIMQQH